MTINTHSNRIVRLSPILIRAKKKDSLQVLLLDSRRNYECIQNGYGHCTQCSCPGFLGSDYTCTRGGCAHHYDEHY